MILAIQGLYKLSYLFPCPQQYILNSDICPTPPKLRIAKSLTLKILAGKGSPRLQLLLLDSVMVLKSERLQQSWHVGSARVGSALLSVEKHTLVSSPILFINFIVFLMPLG